MNLEQMQKYCSTDKAREHLVVPFTKDDSTYATNGVIIIRVPAIDGAVACDKVPVENVFEFATEDLHALSFPHLPPVPDTRKVECSDCEGSGHEHPYCSKCDCACLNCDGTGKETIEPKKYVRIDGELFDLKYVLMLAELAAVSIARRQNNKDPLYFKFDGGDGALMGCRFGADDDVVADIRSADNSIAA